MLIGAFDKETVGALFLYSSIQKSSNIVYMSAGSPVYLNKVTTPGQLLRATDL